MILSLSIRSDSNFFININIIVLEVTKRGQLLLTSRNAVVELETVRVCLS